MEKMFYKNKEKNPERQKSLERTLTCTESIQQAHAQLATLDTLAVELILFVQLVGDLSQVTTLATYETVALIHSNSAPLCFKLKRLSPRPL